MKKERFFELMNNIDDDLIDRAEKGKAKTNYNKSLWIRVAAIAVCFCLIVGAVITVPLFVDRSLPDVSSQTEYDPDYHPAIFDATVSPVAVTGSALEFVVGSSALMGGTPTAEPPAFRFDVGNFVVKAKVVKSFSDLYYKLYTPHQYKPTAYRLVEMETLETLHGENMPKRFLYLIRDYLFVDLSVYDSLLISMDQLGTENYVLRNGTKNQMECVSLSVFMDCQNHPELGNMIAFTGGIFDESLWQTKSWIYGYQFASHELDDPARSDLVVSRGCSEADAIYEIKKRINNQIEWMGEYYEVPTPIMLDFTSEEAKAALEYVKPFANGVFEQSLGANWVADGEVHGALVYTRYINGCQTEETVMIDLLTEEVSYSEVRYTKENLSAIENIAAHISEKAAAYAAQIPLPPHTDPEGKELASLHLYGWYAKVGDQVYGIVKTGWRYMESGDGYTIYEYYDEDYTLYDSAAGTARSISREDLVALVGDRNVYYGELGAGKEMPMC